MRAYTINLVGEVLEVLPNENGTYTISNQEGVLGDLWIEESD